MNRLVWSERTAILCLAVLAVLTGAMGAWATRHPRAADVAGWRSAR